MKKLFYRSKHFWHVLKGKELLTVIPDCLDKDMRSRLQTKANYHEQSAIRSIHKC
ncbi:hypothetical protein ACFSTA_07515 [Ornithinibacillus salinisoli]|uniref:Uncharacterized protein n=1 Tax=Ornithinibacillus salinisoli TaxID=1848459 RepID=A0ABW4VZR8_9BACI